MIIVHLSVVCLSLIFVVEGNAQFEENFSEERWRPSQFPGSIQGHVHRPNQGPRAPGRGFRPFSPNYGRIETTSRPLLPQGESPSSATMLPPRDPTNRVVYTVPCNCPFTKQYSPVCGSDGQTYGNFGVFQCAQRCGSDVKVYMMGACANNNG